MSQSGSATHTRLSAKSRKPAATAMRLAGSRVLIASLSASSSVLPPSSSLRPGQAWELGKRRNGSVGWEKVARWAVDGMVA